jgi:hypothetical protein
MCVQAGLGASPAFRVPEYELQSLFELPLVLVLGALCGVASAAFKASSEVSLHDIQAPCFFSFMHCAASLPLCSCLILLEFQLQLQLHSSFRASVTTFILARSQCCRCCHRLDVVMLATTVSR